MKNIKSFIAGLAISVLITASVAGAFGVNSGGFGTPILSFPVGSELTIGSSTPFTDSGGTLTLQNVDVIDATTETTVEAMIDTLPSLTSIQGQSFTVGATASINQNVTTTGTPTFSGATISNTFVLGATTVLSDASNVATLSAIDAIDSTTETTIESAIDSLGSVTITALNMSGSTIYAPVGANQSTAGASANELWIDSANDYVLKVGI